MLPTVKPSFCASVTGFIRCATVGRPISSSAARLMNAAAGTRRKTRAASNEHPPADDILSKEQAAVLRQNVSDGAIVDPLEDTFGLAELQEPPVQTRATRKVVRGLSLSDSVTKSTTRPPNDIDRYEGNVQYDHGTYRI